MSHSLTSQQALAQLMAGNQRYIAGESSHPNQDATSRQVLHQQQTPFAAILACADSRVPPNIIFDQGLGDLFVIRVAGNILDDAVLGSLEFAVAKLQVPVIMVLGHQNCGAVDAAVQGLQPPGHLGKIVETIQPAVELVKDHQGDWLDNAIRANAQQVSYQLNTMPGFTTPIEANQLMIVPAYYDLFDGTVALL